MSAWGWQIGAILVGASALIIAVYLGKMINSTTKLVEKKPIDIKIDCTDLEYIDSTGLGVLIGVLKRLKVNEKDIYILNPRKNVKKIFDITGLDKIFKVEG